MTYAYTSIDTPLVKASGINVEPVKGYPDAALVDLGNGVKIGLPAHAAERVAQALRDALAPEGARQLAEAGDAA